MDCKRKFFDLDTKSTKSNLISTIGFREVIIKYLFNKIIKNPRKFLTKEQLSKDKHRAVSDFISGMTDRYAINLYRNIK